MRSHILFVTGKLAEPSLRLLLQRLTPETQFDFTVAVLPISVAALASTAWVARHLSVPPGIDRVLLPGLCSGDLEILTHQLGKPVERGPKDLRDLPEFLGSANKRPASYGAYDIAIIAEINHAPRLPLDELKRQANLARQSGADIIDIGCDPASTWTGVGEAIRSLRELGLRLSIDSFDPREVEAAVNAGADLVLSVNSVNCDRAASWGCEVVAIPDMPTNLEGLDHTIERLTKNGVRFRIDPVLEPIGFSFAASLGRYLEVRRRYPGAEMLMGTGNLTELTDVDSAGVNVMLLGFCQELGVRSILTTEVINWCRSSIRELDLARRLVFHSCREHVLPKHLEADLVMLRDPKVLEYGDQELRDLAKRVTDRNFRIFAERGRLQVFNGQTFLEGTDPFPLFEEMRRNQDIDPAHAFYLGYEMAKAVTALVLGKQYVQDEALRWGLLTRKETMHRVPGDGSKTQ